MLLLESEKLKEVHPSYDIHEVVVGIDSLQLRALQAMSDAGEKTMQYWPGLFCDFQLPHFSCDQE